MRTKTKPENWAHAMAEVLFGKLEGDNHTIRAMYYADKEDDEGIEVLHTIEWNEWESARGKSDAEKIEQLLGWSGLQTEHDRGCCFVATH